MTRKLTIEYCKEWAAKNSGSRVLSKEYIDNSTKLQFSCEQCGKPFERSWSDFSGKKMFLCRDCCGKTRWTLSTVKQASHTLGISLLSTEYVNANTPLLFKCACGNTFWRTWQSVWHAGCANCNECGRRAWADKAPLAIRLDIDEVDKRLSSVGLERVSDYVDTKSLLRCRCIKCGHVWDTVAANPLGGSGCPNCAASKGESTLHDLMQSLQLHFIEQFTFPDCIGSKGGKCRFDCAVLDSSDQSPLLLIEFDGVQHFKPVEFFGGQQEFEYRKRNDHIKDSYCRDHGIPLLRISYKQFDQIEQLVTDRLYELNILQKEAA